MLCPVAVSITAVTYAISQPRPAAGYGAGYSDARLGLYRPGKPGGRAASYDAGHCAGRIDAGIPAHKLRNPAKK